MKRKGRLFCVPIDGAPRAKAPSLAKLRLAYVDSQSEDTDMSQSTQPMSEPRNDSDNDDPIESDDSVFERKPLVRMRSGETRQFIEQFARKPVDEADEGAPVCTDSFDAVLKKVVATSPQFVTALCFVPSTKVLPASGGMAEILFDRTLWDRELFVWHEDMSVSASKFRMMGDRIVVLDAVAKHVSYAVESVEDFDFFPQMAERKVKEEVKVRMVQGSAVQGTIQAVFFEKDRKGARVVVIGMDECVKVVLMPWKEAWIKKALEGCGKECTFFKTVDCAPMAVTNENATAFVRYGLSLRNEVCCKRMMADVSDMNVSPVFTVTAIYRRPSLHTTLSLPKEVELGSRMAIIGRVKFAFPPSCLLLVDADGQCFCVAFEEDACFAPNTFGKNTIVFMQNVLLRDSVMRVDKYSYCEELEFEGHNDVDISAFPLIKRSVSKDRAGLNFLYTNVIDVVFDKENPFTARNHVILSNLNIGSVEQRGLFCPVCLSIISEPFTKGNYVSLSNVCPRCAVVVPNPDPVVDCFCAMGKVIRLFGQEQISRFARNGFNASSLQETIGIVKHSDVRLCDLNIGFFLYLD